MLLEKVFNTINLVTLVLSLAVKNLKLSNHTSPNCTMPEKEVYVAGVQGAALTLVKSSGHSCSMCWVRVSESQTLVSSDTQGEMQLLCNGQTKLEENY